MATTMTAPKSANTKAKKTTAPTVKLICECGCGGHPKRGRFLAGHDAILHSRLLTEAREEGAAHTAAVKELKSRGWKLPA